MSDASLKLHFKRLTADYWVANPDGTADERLGEPVYVIRTTLALLRDHPQTPWRFSRLCEACIWDEAGVP